MKHLKRYGLNGMGVFLLMLWQIDGLEGMILGIGYV